MTVQTRTVSVNIFWVIANAQSVSTSLHVLSQPVSETLGCMLKLDPRKNHPVFPPVGLRLSIRKPFLAETRHCITLWDLSLDLNLISKHSDYKLIFCSSLMTPTFKRVFVCVCFVRIFCFYVTMHSFPLPAPHNIYFIHPWHDIAHLCWKCC